MQIEGGYTIRARQTIDSDIFLFKPAIYFKIWFFLVNRANYKENKKRDRGSFHTTYQEITARTGANKDQISKCVRWLKASHMIATKKATRGLHITLVNYCDYQEQDNYKSNTVAYTQATAEPQEGDTKSKERRKKEKKEIVSNDTSIAEFGKKDINSLLEVIKKSCSTNGLIYSGKGQKERNACSRLLSKKFTERISEFNMTLEEFVNNVIMVSTKLKYNTKQVTSAQLLYYNREEIVNKAKQQSSQGGKSNVLVV